MPWLDLSRLQENLATRWLGRTFVYYTSTTSTQDVARREAEAGAPHGAVVVADAQTAGRGRLGRTWLSPPGENLYLTAILRPSQREVYQLAIVAPLAAAKAIEEVTPLRTGIKWPNDVWIGEKKVCGVLIEMEMGPHSPLFALMGIGVNVNMDMKSVPEIAGIATSLRHELGREVSREDLLASLLNHLEALYEASREAPEEIWNQWRDRLITLGRRVIARWGDQVIEGTAEEVDRRGHLLIRRPDGQIVAVEAGDVTLRG